MAESSESILQPVSPFAKEVDNMLKSRVDFKGEIHSIGDWHLFNWLSTGWALRAYKDKDTESVNIRRFKRELEPDDINKMHARMNPKAQEEEEPESSEKGRVFDGVISYNPNEDVILEATTLTVEGLSLGLVIASSEGNRILKKSAGPLRLRLEGGVAVAAEPPVRKDQI